MINTILDLDAKLGEALMLQEEATLDLLAEAMARWRKAIAVHRAKRLGDDTSVGKHIQRHLRIKELESAIDVLKEANNESSRIIKEILNERGENNLRWGGHTVYLHRQSFLTYPAGESAALTKLDCLGMGQYLTRKITNEKDLIRYLDSPNHDPRLDTTLAVGETYRLAVRSLKNHE